MHTASVSRHPLAPPALLLFAVLACAGCGSGNAKALAPSTLTSDPAKYDGQRVTVSGTAKLTGEHAGRYGLTRYKLCDGACINVVAFGANGVTDGSKLTVTGRFRAGTGETPDRFSRGRDDESSGRSHHRRHRRRLTNVLVVGGS